jgi:ubiquinone/menaquinone biosynthesis C-methylase UbiE
MPQSPAAIGNVSQNKVLTEMAMGYSRSRILCAAARLGVADALGDDERSVAEIASICGAHPASLYRLLRALASFGVVAERSPERFVLTSFGKPLRKDAPNSEWSAIVFWADLLADNWARMTECIRTGDTAFHIMERDGVASRWSQDPNASAIFRAVMGTAPAEDYMSIVRAWDFSQCRTAADLGGGGGALIAAALEACPQLRGMLVDRQESIDQAKSRFESPVLAARCILLAADLSESVPAGADVYMLKHVLHGCEDTRAIEILRNVRAVLPPEGRLLVIEFVLPDVVDHADAELEYRLMSDLNMLAVTGGKERSAAEWKRLLRSAGFDSQRIIPVPGELVSIIEGAPIATAPAA